MSTPSEVNNLAKEERIRAIAYSLWEEEGRPEGCAEQHWFRACEQVAAEAELAVDTEADPDWLRREAASVTEQKPTATEQAEEKAAKRGEGKKAA